MIAIQISLFPSRIFISIARLFRIPE